MPDFLPLHFVLHMTDHGVAMLEDHRHGGPPHYRYLNATGRWSAKGTPSVPLLVWPDHASADQAARLAAQARGRSIAVSNVNATTPEHFRTYTEKMFQALQGYLPYKEAASRKLETERHKTMTYARALLAASSGKPLKEVNATIRDTLGSGTVVQAAQFLTGKRCAAIVQGVLDGELEIDSDLTLQSLVIAGEIAHQIAGQLGQRAA